MIAADAIQPPKIAAFLVELCAAPQEVDGILGDLEEGFRTDIAHHGERIANRRYWRHAASTARDLVVAPWGQFVIRGIAGMALGWGLLWTFGAVARQLVVTFPVYSYVPAAIFWAALPLSGQFATGVLVARLARLAGVRPMSVAVSMVAMIAALFAVDVPLLTWIYGPPRAGALPFTSLLLRWAYGVSVVGGLVALGAAVGRTLPRVRRRMPTAA